MKIRSAVVAVALWFTATAVCLASPQMGTWKLNEAKSKLPAEMGKNRTVSYTDEKGQVKVTVDGVDKDGKPTHSVWLGRFDGKTYPVKGNLPYDAVSYKVVDDRTNDITAMKGGKIFWSGQITVAPDGKSRTVTIHGMDPNGKKFHTKAVYDKEE